MNKIIVFFLALSFFSCEKICSVAPIFCKPKPKKIIPINFNEIDQFPQFSNCDEMLNFEEGKTCFETTVHQKISEGIKRLKFISKKDIVDTLQIQFTVNKKGKFVCNKILAKDSLKIKLPKLFTEIQQIIKVLPAINPAQKRGIPITSTYTIPLVINTKVKEE